MFCKVGISHQLIFLFYSCMWLCDFIRVIRFRRMIWIPGNPRFYENYLPWSFRERRMSKDISVWGNFKLFLETSLLKLRSWSSITLCLHQCPFAIIPETLSKTVNKHIRVYPDIRREYLISQDNLAKESKPNCTCKTDRVSAMQLEKRLEGKSILKAYGKHWTL